MKKKALTALAAAAVLLLVGLTACGSKTSQKIVSEALGPDVSGGSEISASDTHKEFHGDGTNCIVLTFQDDAVLEQIKEREDWQPPPDGPDHPHPSVRHLRCDRPNLLSDRPLSERRQRQPEDGSDRTDILHRSSFNLTFGLYDTDTDTLYFCELDI